MKLKSTIIVLLIFAATLFISSISFVEEAKAQGCLCSACSWTCSNINCIGRQAGSWCASGNVKKTCSGSCVTNFLCGYCVIRCGYSSKDCDDDDGTYETGSTRWVSTGACTEKKQKEVRYIDYFCSGGNCVSSEHPKYWIDTGDNRCKSYGTDCGTDVPCTYTNCSADKCDKIGAGKDYRCESGTYPNCPCNWITTTCSDSCASGKVCSGGTCSSGNCKSTNYYCDDQGACDGHKTVYKCDGSGSCDGSNSDDDSECENLNCGKICNPNCLDKCCTKYCDGSGNCESCTPPPCCDDDSDCSACHTCSGGNCVSQGSQADGNKCGGDCTKCDNGSCVNRPAGATAECSTCEKCITAGGNCGPISAETGKNCTSDCYDCVSGSCTAVTEKDDGGCNDDCTRCSSGSCVNRSKCSSSECSSQQRCNAAGGNCRDPDANSTVCIDCYSGAWDSVTSDCCGDDGASDDWCNSGDGSCVNGGWHTNHCSDGVQNCDEEGVDCGGVDCSSCGCNLSRSNDFTIDFECVLGGAHYLQNGNLTIATGGSLQMNADSSFEFDSGYEIKIEGDGYILKSASGTEIRKK